MRQKTVHPTPSYLLQIPADVEEDVDGNVISYWIPGDDTVLQISSYRRESGAQASAQQRLLARIHREDIEGAQTLTLDIPNCPDVAAIRYIDNDEVTWIIAYCVWADLTVFASISRPGTESPSAWAHDSLQSIRHSSN